MHRNVILFCTVVTTLVLCATAVIGSTLRVVPPDLDKWAGTWILNAQKSKYGNEKPPLNPELIKQILKIRVSNTTLDIYMRTELADGTDLADETPLSLASQREHRAEKPDSTARFVRWKLNLPSGRAGTVL